MPRPVEHLWVHPECAVGLQAGVCDAAAETPPLDHHPPDTGQLLQP